MTDLIKMSISELLEERNKIEVEELKSGIELINILKKIAY